MPQNARAILLSAIPVIAGQFIGSRFGPDRTPDTRRWYDGLDKPPFTPPGIVFSLWLVEHGKLAKVYRQVNDRGDSTLSVFAKLEGGEVTDRLVRCVVNGAPFVREGCSVIPLHVLLIEVGHGHVRATG